MSFGTCFNGNAAGSFFLTPAAQPQPGAVFVSAQKVLDQHPRGPYAPVQDPRRMYVVGTLTPQTRK